MAVTTLKDWQGRRYLLQLLVAAWLGCLSHFALAQVELSEKISGSVSFPDLVITCIGNLGVFITCFLKKKLDRYISARDIVANIAGPQLHDINGLGVTTCREYQYRDASVIMLSNRQPNSSIRHFMKYLCDAHGLYSILLQLDLSRFEAATAQICECTEIGGTSSASHEMRCNCIVFQSVEEIVIILARRMPGTIKRVTDSSYLLPSLNCFRNGCHGCNQGLLHVENGQRLTEGNSMLEDAAAVCETLDIAPEFFPRIPLLPDCICIPVHPAGDDDWTKLLIRSLRFEDEEFRSADREVVTASDALQNYMDQRGGCSAIERYKGITVVFPSLTEVIINVVLTVCLRVDGFSSAMIARRAVRNYLPESRKKGFSANMFLVKALVKSNANDTHVCQVLTFTSSVLSFTTLSFVVGIVNLIFSCSWSLVVAFQGGTGQWYDIHSMPLSKPRVAVIISGIGIALLMDFLDLFFLYKRINKRQRQSFSGGLTDRERLMLLIMIVLEMVCIVSGSAVARILGVKGFGKWVYSAMQSLVWVKWGIGSYFIDKFLNLFDSTECGRRTNSSILGHSSGRWTSYKFESGILIDTSSFLLNAILAAVRAKWTYSPSL